MRDVFEWLIAFTIGFIILACFCAGFGYLNWKYEVWRSPCTRVYNGDEVIYEGKSAFYKTESRGVSTIFQENEKHFLFPKMVKEIISDTITAETISCE